MPGLNGLDAAQQVRSILPETKLIFLTVNEDPDVAAEAVRRGALGYVLKKSAATELFTAIERVSEGRHYITPLITDGLTGVFVSQAEQRRSTQGLSPRQREVLQLLAEGRPMKEAADILRVTPRTIAFHKYSIMRQHGLRTSAELVQFAVRLGLVTLPEPPPSTCQF
jgi:DNA-binding NarL/FixJ family response regulator